VVAGYNPDAARKISRIVMEGDRLSLPISWMLGLVALVAAALAALTPRFLPGEEELAKLAPATRP
jgi:hypothetical protein